MTLEELIDRLKKNDNVDALSVTGSAASDEFNPASDYDLLIVIYNKPLSLMSGATELDGRFTDLGFITSEEILKITETEVNTLPLSGRYTTLIRSLRNARILFDSSGRLTNLQQKYQKQMAFLSPKTSELTSRLDRASYNLAHTKRYITSVNPDYHMAVDLRMLYQLDNLMVDYFFVRGQPWPGEKAAIRQWKSNDPDYYDLFQKCLYETNRSKKVKYYEQLAMETMKPIGTLWHLGETRFRMQSEREMTTENLKAADRFWKSLF